MRTYKSPPLDEKKKEKSGNLLVKIYSNNVTVLRNIRKSGVFNNSVLDSEGRVLSFPLSK